MSRTNFYFMTNMTSGPNDFAVFKKYGNIVKYGNITIILIISIANVIIGAMVRSNKLIKAR